MLRAPHGSLLASHPVMPTHADVVADMATLARLHAALDSVVETEQVISVIQETSATPALAVARVSALLGEARQLLRWMLARPEHRHAVGSADTMARRRREP
jgi:hypothetical protein